MKSEHSSWSTRQSNINPNTVIENLFLETFFKQLLSDVMPGKLLNLRQTQECGTTLVNFQKSLAQSLFEVKQRVPLEEITKAMSIFLSRNSPSFRQGELKHLLEVKYSNNIPDSATYNDGQLLFVNVKMKADLQMVENMPLKMKQHLLACEQSCNNSFSIFNSLKNYNKQYINFVAVYFGYYEFNNVNKSHYQTVTLTLFGRIVKLRINAIFVSKVALMQTFKTINKVPHLQELDDLVIDLYHFKRARAKAKSHAKAKKNQQLQVEQKKPPKQINKTVFKAGAGKYGINLMLGITAVGVAVTIGKMFR